MMCALATSNLDVSVSKCHTNTELVSVLQLLLTQDMLHVKFLPLFCNSSVNLTSIVSWPLKQSICLVSKLLQATV